MKKYRNILLVTAAIFAISGITVAFIVLDSQSSVTMSNLTAAVTPPLFYVSMHKRACKNDYPLKASHWRG